MKEGRRQKIFGRVAIAFMVLGFMMILVGLVLYGIVSVAPLISGIFIWGGVGVLLISLFALMEIYEMSY